MNLDERIAKVRVLIAQRDDVDRQIAECLGDAALSVRTKPTQQRKWHKANKRGKELQNDIENFHSGRRQHPETARIEELLIEGKTTLEIIEQVKVSAPTIGVIRARLKTDGRLQ